MIFGPMRNDARCPYTGHSFLRTEGSATRSLHPRQPQKLWMLPLCVAPKQAGDAAQGRSITLPIIDLIDFHLAFPDHAFRHLKERLRGSPC